eukprot:gene5993-7466_t
MDDYFNEVLIAKQFKESGFRDVKTFNFSKLSKNLGSPDELIKGMLQNPVFISILKDIELEKQEIFINLYKEYYGKQISSSDEEIQTTDYEFTKDDEIFQEVQDANRYQEMGNYNSAKTILQRTLQMVEQNLGQKHPITINILFRLVNLEIIIGELSVAEKYVKTILHRTQDQTLSSPYTLPTLYHLLLCHQYQGDYQSCIEVLDKVIDISLKRGDYEVAGGSLLNKAIIESLACLDSSEDTFKQTIDFIEKNLPSTNPLYEMTYGNYACYHHSIEKDESAEKLYLKAIELAEKNNNQKELVHIMTNYSEFLYDSDQFEKAEGYLDKTVKKSEDVLGRNNTKMGSLLFVLGKLYRDKGNLYWAEGFFNKCITIFEDYKNESKRKDRERVELAQQQKDSAVPFTPGKRELELRTNKEVDIDFGNVLWEFAQMLREKGRVPEAYNLEERARKLNSVDE